MEVRKLVIAAMHLNGVAGFSMLLSGRWIGLCSMVAALWLWLQLNYRR